MERISIKAEQMLRFHAGEDMLGYLFTTTHNEVELVMQGSVQVKEEEWWSIFSMTLLY